MASYQVEWKRSARKELRRLPQDVIRRVIEAVDQLAQTPFPAGAIKLSGAEHTYRLRVGEYRVIYTVEQNILFIEIIRVRHRRDAYRF